MARLPLARLRSRLALDYRAMRSMRGATLGRVEAFASPLDLQHRREVGEVEGMAGLATVYRVEFRFRMLQAPGREIHRAWAVFETSPQGHPFESPRVHFAPQPVPYSPHVRAESGLVCLGSAWEDAGGQWLLPHLVVHVMRIANFDEPYTQDGFSADAVHYARRVLGGRPLNPGLDYPVIDERVTHSGHAPDGAPAEAPAPLFRRSSVPAPRVVAAAPEPALFARRLS